ncbi:hypothetical protein ACJX0J_033580, partial [Zea mays]
PLLGACVAAVPHIYTILLCCTITLILHLKEYKIIHITTRKMIDFEIRNKEIERCGIFLQIIERVHDTAFTGLRVRFKQIAYTIYGDESAEIEKHIQETFFFGKKQDHNQLFIITHVQ